MVKIGDRIAAATNTLAYVAGDKWGRIEHIERDIFYCRMEPSRRLTPFSKDQFTLDPGRPVPHHGSGPDNQ